MFHHLKILTQNRGGSSQMNEEILSHLAIKGRQKQGRVTDAAGERSALVRALRRHKPGPAKGSGKHGATQTRSPVGAKANWRTARSPPLSLLNSHPLRIGPEPSRARSGGADP